ncbi:MAG: cyclic nucleotide-binding domain-containing protein [Acidimicrobiales bacterium]
MRIQSSVTSLSWIPSEAIDVLSLKLPFEMGIAHYDDPPPDVIDDLDALRAADRFRFANRLVAWIDVEDGVITGYGQGEESGGIIGSTTMRVGNRAATFEAVPLPDIAREPEVTDTSVTFTQTAGGRTGVPAPRRVKRKPFVQVSAPLAWATLSLTIDVDGSAEGYLVGASPFPRHWVYDHAGQLSAKTGLIDFKTWYRTAFGEHSPWGDHDSPALATAVESALECRLSAELMRPDRKAKVRKLDADELLTEQGQPGAELFLLLDGVLSVEVDGVSLGEIGPGAILGERAMPEGGHRTSTLRALTACKVAVASADDIEPAILAELSESHRREEQ